MLTTNDCCICNIHNDVFSPSHISASVIRIVLVCVCVCFVFLYFWVFLGASVPAVSSGQIMNRET